MPNSRTPDPTEGMSALDLFLAGVGRGMHHTGLGVGQSLGLVSRQDIEDARALDDPLLGKTSARVGNVLGMTSLLAPTALLPGANTLLGAGLIGGATGLLQPSISTDETLRNVAAAGLLGPAGIAAGRGMAEARGLLALPATNLAR